MPAENDGWVIIESASRISGVAQSACAIGVCRERWVDAGRLIVCLEEKITQTLVDTILTEKPQQLITLDRAFTGSDPLKTNTALQLEAEKTSLR